MFLQGDEVVGVAFQGLTQADNTGYMIPTPVVKRFLKDVEDGVYDKYVELGISTFDLHNPAMRKVLGLKSNEPGVLVVNVVADGSSEGVIKEEDIIVSVDGYQVDASGNVVIHGERVDMNEIAERKFVGDKVKVGILRDGKKIDTEVTLKKFDFGSIYALQYDKKPLYTMRGGLLFQPLSGDLYKSQSLTDSKIRKISNDYIEKEIFKKKKDVVILTRILKDQTNSSISFYSGLVLDSINGEAVESLKHTHELLNPEKMPEFFVIKCAGVKRPLILRGDLIEEADARIQKQYGISQLFNLNK